MQNLRVVHIGGYTICQILTTYWPVAWVKLNPEFTKSDNCCKWPEFECSWLEKFPKIVAFIYLTLYYSLLSKYFFKAFRNTILFKKQNFSFKLRWHSATWNVPCYTCTSRADLTRQRTITNRCGKVQLLSQIRSNYQTALFARFNTLQVSNSNFVTIQLHSNQRQQINLYRLLDKIYKLYINIIMLKF